MDFGQLEAFECRLEDGVFHLILNRPNEGNTFGTAFCQELDRIVNRISEWSEVRCVLISARGKFFSVGGDIGLMAGAQERLPALVKALTSPLHMAIARLMQLNAPVVCAVHGGGAFGGAVALAAAADILLTGSNARFGAAFTSLGFSCDSGTTVGLSQRLGVARARRFLLLNEILSAEEALAAGLVDKVVNEEQLMDQATAIAINLASGPTLAYGEVKRLFLSASSRAPAAQMEEEAQALAKIARTKDAQEGLQAFLVKRKPVFSGQ
jgi:2-(1,2-epoxy-1,2-dihydrophenyl)acetyl-CoA isomerase